MSLGVVQSHKSMESALVFILVNDTLLVSSNFNNCAKGFKIMSNKNFHKSDFRDFAVHDDQARGKIELWRGKVIHFIMRTRLEQIAAQVIPVFNFKRHHIIEKYNSIALLTFLLKLKMLFLQQFTVSFPVRFLNQF